MNGEYLTAAEQEALTTRGLRKRAQALNQLLSLATQLGLDEAAVERGVAGVRELSPKKTKKIRKALATVSRAFGEGPIASEPAPVEDSADDVVLSEEPTLPVSEEVAEKLETSFVEVAAEPISSEAELPGVDDDEELTIPSLTEHADVVINPDQEENTQEVSADGVYVLRRLSKAQDLSIDNLSTRDIDTVLQIIATATQGNQLSKYTGDKLRALLAGVPKSRVEGAESALTNVYNSIKKSGKTAQLAASLRGIDVSTALSDTVVEPIEPIEPEAVILVEEAQTTEEDSQPEKNSLAETDIDDILRVSLSRPEAVSRRDWLKAAEARLRELAETKGFSSEQTTQLWDWIHFDDNGDNKQDLTEGAKSALDILQKSYLEPHQAEYFKNIPLQNVGMRTLLIRAMGVLSLDKIYDKMASLKSNQTNLTKTMAERHVVAGVLHLLGQG